mgnify:CR=1 FL=1
MDLANEMNCAIKLIMDFMALSCQSLMCITLGDKQMTISVEDVTKEVEE